MRKSVYICAHIRTHYEFKQFVLCNTLQKLLKRINRGKQNYKNLVKNNIKVNNNNFRTLFRSKTD